MDFRREAAQVINNALRSSDFGVDEIYDMIEVPGDSAMGDFAFPCFRLAKQLRQSPPVLATELQLKIYSIEIMARMALQPRPFKEIKAAGAYVNFSLDKEFFAQAVVSEILQKGAGYCAADAGGGKTVVMDYSSPNIAKRMHIGHLYSTVIGASLNRIYRCLGYNVVGINYLGDWGTQFGKLIVAFKLWGSEERVAADGVEELERIYVKFHQEVETNPALEDDARAWLLKMQNGDEDALKLWEWFKDISIKEYEKMYKRLGVPFDSYRGESYYNDKMDAAVDEIRAKGLLKTSNDAQIVDLEEFKMPPCLILRSDGGTLYPTRDVAAALDRKKTYDFHKSLYITDMRQSLHFAQFFKVLGLMGYEWETDMVHIPYGLLSFEGDNLSSRKGNALILESLFDQAVEKVLGIINDKNPELADKETVAEQVGTGAIVFSALYNSRVKDTTFSWDRIFAFDGETGPYVQYTHARCASVLEKAGAVNFADAELTLLNDKFSFDVIKLLEQFPQKIAEAAEKYEPFVVSRAIMEIVTAFNKFYHENPVLKADDATRAARLCLVKCVKDIVRFGLELVGVAAPEKM